MTPPVVSVPAGKAATYVATLDDGSQILIDVWSPESVTVATRERRSDVWSPPTEAEVAA